MTQSSTSKPDEQTRWRNADVRVGARVRVRGQRWVITNVCAHEDCAALTLTGLGPLNRGQQQQVLAPFDLIEPLSSKRSFRIVRPTRWRRVCRQLIADAGPAGILRTAVRARMDLMPHQLAPALSIVHGTATRILIADDVGLGKTVQAALIVAELKSRGAVSRVLVLTPAGLREQWVDECANRFDLHFALFDVASVVRHRASLPIGLNPWSVEPLIVTSIDYVKRPEVGPSVLACRWDLVIVDEAHHAAAGTDRHNVIAALCRTAPYVVLLTATPHSGDPRAFASLCDLGRHDDRLVIFRRTRQHIGQSPDRRIHQLRVQPSASERTMHAAVGAFIRAVQQESGGRDRATRLALSTLQKRALSSAFALKRSVERRLSSFDSSIDNNPRQIALPLLDVGGEFDGDDDMPPWAIPALGDPQHERALLTRIARAAAAAVGRESKLAALRRLLRRVKQSAVVFTEYRDTLIHVRAQVMPAATILHGGLSRQERRLAITRFRNGGVLLATDAAGEGLNLHHACRLVVNLELPWNPMRLEQRIGRVDRIGQTGRVHAFHLIADATSEVRILHRLLAKVARAREDIDTANPLYADDPRGRVDASTTDTLVIAAGREHERLTMARTLAGSRSEEPQSSAETGHHGLVMFSRRRRLRFRLPSRALVLVRTVLCDDGGQTVASHITPLEVVLYRDARRCLQPIEALATALPDDPDYGAWLSSSRRVHRTFWITRLRREQAIAAAAERQAGNEMQPGLFDWRAERGWTDSEDQRRDGIWEQSRQSIAATRTADLTVEPPHVVLVLFTK